MVKLRPPPVGLDGGYEQRYRLALVEVYARGKPWGRAIVLGPLVFDKWEKRVYLVFQNHLQKLLLIMKMKAFVIMASLFAGAALMFQGCNKCDVSGTVDFAADKQYVALTYLVDSSGANYNTIWRQSQIGVLFNDNGGKGQFVSMSEDISDGVIGPFTYSFGVPDAATKGVLKHFVYVIQKDSFGSDTVEVKFLPAVDECREYWALIEYYRNGELLPEYSNKEIAEIEIRE